MIGQKNEVKDEKVMRERNNEVNKARFSLSLLSFASFWFLCNNFWWKNDLKL